MNLLIETTNCLHENGYDLGDVKAVGCHEFTIPIDSFVGLAMTEYDQGFGSAEVAQDLTILMSDGGVFYRHEYDGAEYWMHVPPVPDESREVRALTIRQAHALDGESWHPTETLRELNDRIGGE